jgi:hypothetical protein
MAIEDSSKAAIAAALTTWNNLEVNIFVSSLDS